MQYRRLGASGLKVSPLCLGAMMFGIETDASVAQRIVASARDAGVNFIDTANAYGKGASETMVGELIRADRHRWVLATKVGNPFGVGPNETGLGRKWICQAIDESLKRLQTDYVDLYYFHWDDPLTPLDESIGAMADLIRAGKVRHWGFSNYRAWKIGEIMRVAKELNAPRPIAAQQFYNCMSRLLEAEFLPAAEHHGIGVVAYSPLARGVLTAKYVPGAGPPAGSRAARKDPRILEAELRPESLAMAQRIRAHAERRGTTAAKLAFQWVLNNRLVAGAIGGPRTFEQWQDYVDSMNYPFLAEDEAFFDGLVAAGHISTPNFTDPKHPVLGRVPRS